ATLRASAEQLDHLSRRDGAASGSSTNVAAALVPHRRSASDAAVRGYRPTSEDSLDYEETPRVGRGRNGEDDGQWANEAEAAMSAWYQPRISREQAVAALRDAPAGSFIVRDSQTYLGAYGLAVRVLRPPTPQQQQLRPHLTVQDPRDSLMRHFLIEVSPGGGGVRIRGCSNEPVFRSLSELVQCHSLTLLALPCCLRLPKLAKAQTATTATSVRQSGPKSSLTAVGSEPRAGAEKATSGRRGTTHKVLYFCTVDVPLSAVNNQTQWPHKAVSSAVGQVVRPGGPRPIECRMRISGRGIKLSGLGWHTEFRLAYSAEDCLACELDPAGRSLFGLLVKKYGFYGDQNACLVLGGNLDSSAKSIVEFVNRSCMQPASLMQQHR
uniref:SH2 domain-containing protein n=1 Tax=Macrostomum lignano TaxID=282301 RepID=A0A1I8GMC2_9PLAT